MKYDLKFTMFVGSIKMEARDVPNHFFIYTDLTPFSNHF
jgi:hypothetical protein